jgi:hypothetical protein
MVTPISSISSVSPAISGGDDPVDAATRVDSGGDAVRLQDNVALDRRRGTVFAQFVDPVDARRARAENLEDDHRVLDDGGVARHWGARNEGVRVADAAGHLDLEGWAADPAWPAP